MRAFILCLGLSLLFGCDTGPLTSTEPLTFNRHADGCPANVAVVCDESRIGMLTATEPICPWANKLVDDVILKVPGTWNVSADIVCVNGVEYDIKFLIAHAFNVSDVCDQLHARLVEVCGKK